MTTDRNPDSASNETSQDSSPLESPPPSVQDPIDSAIEVSLQMEPKAPGDAAPAEASDTFSSQLHIDLAKDAQAEPLPLPGGPGSHPAPFDPRQASFWQALLAEFEREIAAIGDVPAAAKIYYEAGKIWEEKLAQPRNAWNCYNKAYQLQPKFVPNIRAAGRLAAQVGNWNVAVEILKSEIEATEDTKERSYLNYRLGLILEEKLGKMDDARVSYDAALNLLPTNVEFLKQQERLAIATGDWKTILDIRYKLLDIIQDQDVSVQLLLSCAKIHQAIFKETEKAERTYRRVLEVQPNNFSALDALRFLYSETKRYDSLLEILQREAQFTTDPHASAWLHFLSARLLREQIGDEDRAIDALQQAHTLSPENHMILAEMANLYESLMLWQELVDVYDKQVNVITDRKELVSLHFKLGNIWEERLFNEDEAILHYRKVIELNPNYLPALQGLGKLLYRKGQWDKLVQMYEIEIRETPDAKLKSVKLYKLAEILEERVSRDTDAIQKLEQCLELSPGYLPALKSLGRLYTKYSRWDSLIVMYEAELGFTKDHDQQVFLLDKIGNLWEEKLNNTDKAIETYQRILEVSPNYLPAIRTLGKLYIRADRWQDLIRINDLEAQLINDQKQVVSLLHRNGEIFEEKLNDKDSAIEMYKKVLAIAPAYIPALQNLGRLYFIKGRWEDLIAMHRQEIEVTQNEDHQIDLLYKIGELYEEKLVQEDKAIVAYQEVLRIQSSNFPAMKALIRIMANKRDWESLIEIYEKEATVFEDPQQKALSLFRIAEIWETHLNQPDKAIDVLQQILNFVSNHEPAMRYLVRLYSMNQNWRGLVSIYERELALATHESQQVEILSKMSEIYSLQANDLIRASECHEKILAIKPNHMPSIEALERIYLSQRNYAALVRIYEAFESRTSDKQLKLTLQAQIADIKENRLQPPQNSGDNHLKVLGIDSVHPQSVRALDSLYHKFGTWKGLRQLYEQELSRVSSEELALDLCIRIADLAETKLQQPDVAAHYLHQALRLSPDHLPAIKALKRVSLAIGDHESIIGLLNREGQVTRDPRQSIATLLQAGQIYRERFNDIPQAIECFFRVLERDPAEVQAFGQLETLLTQQQNWERLAILYKNRLAAPLDTRSQAEINIKLGNLLREHLGRPADALECFLLVLQLNPAQLQALSVLAELTFETEDWEKSVDFSLKIIELTVEPRILTSCYYRLGVIYQEKLPNLQKAIEYFHKVLELSPKEASTLQRLKAIHIARQQWSDAIGALNQLIELNPDPANQVKLYLEMASIYEEGINDPDQAAQVYQRLHQIYPSDVSVIKKLGELYERLEKWAELTDSYQSFIRLLPPENLRDAIPLHLKMGWLFSEKLRNNDKAILEYKQVVEADPQNQDAHLALARLYGSTSLYYANAVDEHRKLLELMPLRIDSYHELRRIFEEQRAFDKVFCACAVLYYLRACDKNEEFFYGENRTRIPESSAGQLTPEEFDNLLTHPKERGLVREIIKLVAPHLSKVFPPVLEKYGIGKQDRARPEDGLFKLCKSMAANIGSLEFEVFHTSQPTFIAAVENSDPPSLIIDEGLIKRTVVKEQRFALGRALKRIADGSYITTKLGIKNLPQLIALLVAPFQPSSPLVTSAGELPADLDKAIQKALPRKCRRSLEELIQERVTETTMVPDYESYLRAAEHSANRMGLLLCGDLAQAALHLSRESPELRDRRLNNTEEITAALSRDVYIKELLKFSVSEECFRLRIRMKLSLVG